MTAHKKTENEVKIIKLKTNARQKTKKSKEVRTIFNWRRQRRGKKEQNKK